MKRVEDKSENNKRTTKADNTRRVYMYCNGLNGDTNINQQNGTPVTSIQFNSSNIRNDSPDRPLPGVQLQSPSIVGVTSIQAENLEQYAYGNATAPEYPGAHIDDHDDTHTMTNTCDFCA